jgi:hypothetical protein
MEQTAAKSGRPLETMNREELLRAWNAQKPAGEATTESTNNDMERGTNHEQN